MEQDKEYEFLLDKIMRNVNVNFREYRPQVLKRRLELRLHSTGCNNYWDYILLLNKDPHEYDRLITVLTIKESYFFRDTEVFELLQNRVIPEIISQKQTSDARQIRAWSCGMVFGQEAYSMAILLREVLGIRLEDLEIRVLATDIDNDTLEKAPWGSYDARALRNMAPHLLFKYFTLSQDRYLVNEAARSLVSFERHDVVSGVPKYGMDLVTTANLWTSSTRRHNISSTRSSNVYLT